MLDGSWRTHVALGGILAVVGLAAWLGLPFVLPAEEQPYQGACDNAPVSGQQADPHQAPAQAAGIQRGVYTGADTQNPRNDCYTRQDLRQQTAMAEAADWLGLWAFFQTLAALASVGLLIATVRYARRAAKAAEVQAGHAETQVGVAREAMQTEAYARTRQRRWDGLIRDRGQTNTNRQLRAYLGAKHPERTQLEIADAVVRITNFGQTPAYGVVVWADLRPMADDALDFQLHGPVEEREGIVINPTDMHEYVARLEAPLTEADRKAIREGTRGFYYWGEVRYLDAFNEPHATKFRMRWDHRVGPRYGMWKLCLTGNSSD